MNIIRPHFLLLQRRSYARRSVQGSILGGSRNANALPGPGHSAQIVITRVEALHSFNTKRPAYAAGASVIGFHGPSRPLSRKQPTLDRWCEISQRRRLATDRPASILNPAVHNSDY
jgi:hypothetical protein